MKNILWFIVTLVVFVGYVFSTESSLPTSSSTIENLNLTTSESLNQSTESLNQSTESQNQTTESQNQTTESQNQTTDSINQTTESQGQTTESQGQITESQGQITNSYNLTTISTVTYSTTESTSTTKLISTAVSPITTATIVPTSLTLIDVSVTTVTTNNLVLNSSVSSLNTQITTNASNEISIFTATIDSNSTMITIPSESSSTTILASITAAALSSTNSSTSIAVSPTIATNNFVSNSSIPSLNTEFTTNPSNSTFNYSTNSSITTPTITISTSTLATKANQPVDLFQSIDPRLVYILSKTYPTLSATDITNIGSNTTQFLPLLDNITSWDLNCVAAQQYYDYLEDELVKRNQTYLTYDRLSKILKCKQDCNFARLLSIQSNFTENCNPTDNITQCDNIYFAKYVIKYLPSQAAVLCRNNFPLLTNQSQNISASDLINNIQEISLLTSQQLNQFTPSESISIAEELKSKNTVISPELAKSLGANIPTTANLSQVASIASSIPLECFNSTTPNNLVNLLNNMDLDNMNSLRKTFITNQITKSNDSNVITNLLTTTSDSTIINSIPSYLFTQLSINISSIPVKKLPKAALKTYAKSVLETTNLTNIQDADTLSKILPGVSKNDLNKISDNSKKENIIKMVSASLKSGVDLSSSQRSAMLNSLLSSLSVISNSNDPSVYLNFLNGTEIASLYPLFIEANSTILNGLKGLNIFGNLIDEISTMSLSQCCLYSRSVRKTFTSYAVAFKFNYMNLALSDLYKLGPCLVSTLPNEYLNSLSPSVFVTYFSTLGNVYQPDTTGVTYCQSLINSYVNNSTLTAGLTQDTLFFTTLSDLALFYPFTTKANQISLWVTNGGSLYAKLTSNRDYKLEKNQLCQAGLTNQNDYSNLINSLGSTFVSRYVSIKSNGLSSARRKRSVYSYTCSDLNTLGNGIVGLTATQLNTLALSEFYSCQLLIGSSSNQWSQSQLNILASKALAYYTTASSISNSNLIALNKVLLGFSTSDLSSLSLTTLNAITTLGGLSAWSTSQLNALATPLTNYINTELSGTITSGFISSAGNLLCSLSDTQINSISEAILISSISTVSSISLSCPNINTWYTKVKSTSTYSNLLNSNGLITELGSIMAGITVSDLTSLSSDTISSFGSNSLKYMPAATVNTLSIDQLNGLTVNQVVSLQQSPNVGSFSSTITNGLTSSIAGQQITATQQTKRNGSNRNYLHISVFILNIILVLFLN